MTKSFIFVNLLCYFGYVHGDQRNVQCSGLCHCKTIINLKTQPQVKCGKFWKQAMLKEFRTCSKLNSLAGRVTEFFLCKPFPFFCHAIISSCCRLLLSSLYLRYYFDSRLDYQPLFARNEPALLSRKQSRQDKKERRKSSLFWFTLVYL